MLKNKIVVVVGGAGLLGEEFIKAIINYNGIAIIADINEDIGTNTKKSISDELDTNNIDFFKIDITSKESVLGCIKNIVDNFFIVVIVF